VASRARDLLNRAASPGGSDLAQARASKLERYLTQPFFVAEAFTNRPGVTVSRDVAVADVRALMEETREGPGDDALYMTGSLADALERG